MKKLTPAEAAVVVERSMAELVLNATILSGEKRLAMINGHAYRPGEAIVASDPAAQLRVAEIHHHRVVLEREGKRVDLNTPTSRRPPRSVARGNWPARTIS